MQQAGEFGFLFQAEGAGTFFRQPGHRAEMVPEQLPTAFIHQPFALVILGGVRKIIHALASVLPAWRHSLVAVLTVNGKRSGHRQPICFPVSCRLFTTLGRTTAVLPDQAVAGGIDHRSEDIYRQGRIGSGSDTRASGQL